MGVSLTALASADLPRLAETARFALGLFAKVTKLEGPPPRPQAASDGTTWTDLRCTWLLGFLPVVRRPGFLLFL